jgi:hypothetical protein
VDEAAALRCKSRNVETREGALSKNKLRFSSVILPSHQRSGAPFFALLAKGGMPLLLHPPPSRATSAYPTLRRKREGWGTRSLVAGQERAASTIRSRLFSSPSVGRGAHQGDEKQLLSSNYSHGSGALPFVTRPERTRISYLTLLATTTCAVFLKENRMLSINATGLDRKSGGAQWRDLRFSSLFLGMFFN